MDNASLSALIVKLSDSLTRAGYLMATAESCTGGMIAARCTGMSGSSAWFAGGIVSYSNGMKRDVLHVRQALLDRHGAVSGPVVESMALGALTVCGADASVAVSGIAGPTGGTPEKPVGTVWIAVAVKEKAGRCICGETHATLSSRGPTRVTLSGQQVLVSATHHLFAGNRDAVRDATVETSLRLLYALLDDYLQ